VIKAALALVLTLAIGCGGAASGGECPKIDRVSLEAELKKADQDFAEATDKRGVDGWVSYFAPDGAQLSARAEVVRGPDAVREQMTQFFAKAPAPGARLGLGRHGLHLRPLRGALGRPRRRHRGDPARHVHDGLAS
jgi:hypothetical protein